MPPFRPTSRRDLIRVLKKLGFTGPFSGGKQEFIERGDVTLRLPNPHGSDVDVAFLSVFCAKGGISDEEWLNA